MFGKEKVYLLLSLISSFLLLTGIIQVFPKVTFIGLRFSLIWIPVWILILLLPLYGIVEIIKRTDEANYMFWIALLLNLFNFFIAIRHFNFQFLST
ncbi:hypothetical protein DI487_15705 [Flavobacterium sediminis]|uniref:Uncharacterized protein n=2 Tax=Flavobacteriaceae TaxID=49546 RepID=A0A2U8QYL7_9FLAO|nr:hypothetical protein DI487_15705 [Flavobacterium sediminis]